MNELIFIADYYTDEILGGAEIYGDILLDELRRHDFHIVRIKSSAALIEELDKFPDCSILLGNFSQLPGNVKRYIETRRQYCLLLHDYPITPSRNPNDFAGYKIPQEKLINVTFIQKAKRVFCQSELQSVIIEMNTGAKNLINLSGNLYDDIRLDYLTGLRGKEKKEIAAIQGSQIWHKNTAGAVQYCEAKKIPYFVIPPTSERMFWHQLAGFSKFVFLPMSPETCSRATLEAKMLGLGLILNNRVGIAQEKWFRLFKEEDSHMLIEYMRQKRTETVEIIADESR